MPQLWRIRPKTYNWAEGSSSLKKSPGTNLTRDSWDSGESVGIKWDDTLTAGGNSRTVMFISGYLATAWCANAPEPPVQGKLELMSAFERHRPYSWNSSMSQHGYYRTLWQWQKAHYDDAPKTFAVPPTDVKRPLEINLVNKVEHMMSTLVWNLRKCKFFITWNFATGKNKCIFKPTECSPCFQLPIAS